MEIVSPNSNSTSNFFIPTKDSSNDSINGCNFKAVIEPSPNIENFKDNIVPKFANGFFKPDMFMGSNLEKKKRGRPRKIDPNLSFSDSSSNISSIPPSPQSYNKEIYPQNGSNIDFNNIISAPGSQYSPYTNTTSETIDDLTLPSDETYEQMFKMINSACQEARSFYKESRGLKDFPDIPSTSKEMNRSRRKSMSNHQMTSPNGKMDQRRKSESLSKNLQSPQGTEDFGFKLSRRKSDGSNHQAEKKLTEAQKKKLLSEKLDKYKFHQPLISKIPQIKSLTSYQLVRYMRKVRQRPQVQKFLSTELYEFVFEEPCLSSPSTSKEHDQRTWERFEENPAKNDDPDELTDKSSDEESIFGDGEINDQENFEFFQARAKIIATDIKCMRRFQEVEAMLAKKQREMLARFPSLKLEDEEHKEKLDDSTLTCARCRPIPTIYQNRTRPRLIRQNLTPNSSNQPSVLPQKGKSLERHFIDHFWHDAHLSKDVLNQRKEMFQEVDYVKKDSKTLQKFFTSDDSKKRKSPKKKKPTTPTTSPLKNRKQQLPKKTIISSPIHKKLLKKSLARKRKANHKPSKPPPILRRSEGKSVKDFFSQGWRLSHESNSKNRSIRNIQLPSNEIHEALAKLANEAHYDEIFIPTWQEIDLIEDSPKPQEDDCKCCKNKTTQLLFTIAREHHELEHKERHWHASVSQSIRLTDRRRSEQCENSQTSTSTSSNPKSSIKNLVIPPFEDSSTFNQLPNLLDDLLISSYDRPSDVTPYEPRPYMVNSQWIAAKYAKNFAEEKGSSEVLTNKDIKKEE